METTTAFVGLDCLDCDQRFDASETTHRCPECGGILDPAYDYDALNIDAETFATRRFDTLWRYEEVLPFPRETAVTMNEGGTPLVECPTLADSMGVGEVYIKDEGRNPTGTFKDRGQTGAVTAAIQHGADAIALDSAGNAGQSAAAYAAAGGLEAHVWLPERSGFIQRAMTEVHGGNVRVVDGDFGDAGAAYNDAIENHPEWHSVRSFVNPYRHETKKTMLYETVEQLDWVAPDAVIYPTGGGVGLVGMQKAARELMKLGMTESLPGMYVAQSAGCAPVVEAWNENKAIHEAWDGVSTAFGGIAVPDPSASPLILDALEESGGEAAAATDDAIADAAIEVAQTEGIEMGATCAAAAATAFTFAERGDLDSDDTVVLINTGTGNKDASLLRSQVAEREGNATATD